MCRHVFLMWFHFQLVRTGIFMEKRFPEINDPIFNHLKIASIFVGQDFFYNFSFEHRTKWGKINENSLYLKSIPSKVSVTRKNSTDTEDS